MVSPARVLRHASRIIRAERTVATAAWRSIDVLLATSAKALQEAGYDAAVLDDRLPGWRAAVAENVLPAVADVFTEAWEATARGDVTVPSRYVTNHLASVSNRVVGVADTVFDTMRLTLEEGRQNEESIPDLAARIDLLLADDQRWKNRATTIARTEVIGANNAGATASAGATAEALGVEPGLVVKEWMATSDGRTRPTHVSADGLQVRGTGALFNVGSGRLEHPGDPSGPAEEVVNCVVGSTQVAWPGQVVNAVSRRSYSGEFIKITTARGHDLTVTPNHPVLTPTGYVPAQALRPGEYVLATDRPPPPEVKNGPPSIEQVQRAALKDGTPCRVRGRRVHFHGDGTDSEVEVVRTDRHLSLNTNPETGGKADHQPLVSLSNAPGPLTLSGGTQARPEALGLWGGEDHRPTPPSPVGSLSPSAPLLSGHSGRADEVGLGGRSDVQTYGGQPAGDRRSADPEVVRHLHDAVAFGMTPCEVTEVNRYRGTHDVFNLETSDAWYVGAGVAQHNCRCTVVFYYPGDPDYPAGLSEGNTAASVPRYPGTPPGSTADAEQAVSARPPTARAADVPVDSGPASPMETMARNLTIQELEMETRRGSSGAKKVAKAELRRRGLTAAGAHPTPVPLTAADEETPMTEQAPEQETPTDEVEPTHAGVAVQAADTGRVLLLQRRIDPTDDPEVRGTWEFPGGSIEEGETPQEGAWREFGEETDLPAPVGEVTGQWDSPDGVYRGFLFTTPVEDDAFPEGLNPSKVDEALTDPDNPERRAADVTAWFTREQIIDLGPALRPEVRTTTDWEQFMPTPTDTEQADPAVKAALAVVRTAGYSVALTAAEGDDPTEVDELPVTDVPAPDGTPGTASDIPEGGDPFYGIAAPEGVVSGDGRVFGDESLTWRDLPLPLMYQDATAEGHDGAVRVGRIDVMERDSTGPKPMIRYSGVWDTSDIAVEAQRQVAAKVLRGVSVDCDAVTVELVDSTGEVLDPMTDDFPEDGVVSEVASAARICGATLCSIPAFHQAYTANGTLADRTDPEPGQAEVSDPATDPALVTPPVTTDPAVTPVAASAAPAWSLVASVGITQPADAFTRPAALDATPEGYPLTVTDDGRVYGHLAVWGTCHIGISGLCQEPPASASNYAHFASGFVATDDGSKVATGPLVMETGHAGMTLGARAAASHYDNTGTCVADVTMGQDHIGIWYAGVLRPGITPEQVYALRAAGKVSGDWRECGGTLDLVAALIVNTPGFPVPRPALAASSGHAYAMVAAGVVATRPEPLTAGVDHHAIAAAVVATLDRRDKARTASARLTTHRARHRHSRVVAATARLTREG